MSKTFEISSIPFFPNLTEKVISDLKALEEKGIENVLFNLEEGVSIVVGDNIRLRYLLGKQLLIHEEDGETFCIIDFNPSRSLRITTPAGNKVLLEVEAEEGMEEYLLSTI